MSFGGSVAAMITSLKNNKRSRISTFEKLKDYKNVEYVGKIDKKASPELLKKIREKLQKENRRKRIIAVLYFIISLTVLIILLKLIMF